MQLTRLRGLRLERVMCWHIVQVIRMQLTRLRGLRHITSLIPVLFSSGIRMQLTRLRGLRHAAPLINLFMHVEIRMQLTRLRGLRQKILWIAPSRWRLISLECSWPDLGDWDNKWRIRCKQAGYNIRMQLTRLRGLRPLNCRLTGSVTRPD